MLSSPPRRDTPTRTHRLLIALTIVAAIFFQQLPLIPSIVAEAASSTIVISQVYGGGGSTSTSPVPAYKNDYIELFNRGTSSVSLVGWSVQYAATGGSSWAVTPLSGSIAPGQYYLVQEGTATGATGATLPTANASGTISMAAGAGKVALVNSTTALVGAGSGSTLPPAPIGGSIIDYVGYGSGTSSYEGAGPTGSNLSTILAAFRASGGCKDDDSNSADFATGTPSARNASSPLNICNTAVAPSITTQPQSQTITSGQTATLNVTASGTAPLTYQWYQGTAPDTSTPVGTNSTSYTTPALSNTTNYWVRVSNSTGTANSNTATITVNALNPGALQFNSATYSVNENGGSVTITVTRTGGSDGAVSINYATSNGSATSGSDYTATSGTLSYANSETSKTFSVPVIDDTTYEGNETVNLLLSSPTGGATLGSPSSAVLTIIENDPQPNQPIATNCPNPPSTVQGTATSVGVSATDPDGRVISASIISAPVAGITLNSFTPAAASGGTATATLNVSNATAAGTYNVDIQYSNNDSPTPQAATCTVVVNVQPPPTPAGAVVISQIYGGGGNAGAFYRYDFIEIFNRSSQPINLNGWSVQYAS
ncbi:MAG TPA: lamin tail domain-containing protein, partial [Pyrinomonadaceae bacterium]|nr:lamin tail domain-containing protein [Pyrinomonadaceae bacterium]